MSVGTRYEGVVKADLMGRGYAVARFAASQGFEDAESRAAGESYGDLIAVGRGGLPILVECKSDREKMAPSVRAALVTFCERHRLLPVVAYKRLHAKARRHGDGRRVAYAVVTRDGFEEVGL